MGNPIGGLQPFAYGALTVCGVVFQTTSARSRLCNSVKGLVPLLSDPTTPNRQRHQAIAPTRFRLFPFRSPLLRESLLLSSPRGTQMFQFPRFPLSALCVQAGVTPHYGCRVSPFGHPRIEARSAAPRGLSQPPTSFFGFRRQGIHRWLFVAWNKDARARFGILKGLLGTRCGHRLTFRDPARTGRLAQPESWEHPPGNDQVAIPSKRKSEVQRHFK